MPLTCFTLKSHRHENFCCHNKPLAQSHRTQQRANKLIFSSYSFDVLGVLCMLTWRNIKEDLSVFGVETLTFTKSMQHHDRHEGNNRTRLHCMNCYIYEELLLIKSLDVHARYSHTCSTFIQRKKVMLYIYNGEESDQKLKYNFTVHFRFMRCAEISVKVTPVEIKFCSI